MIKLEPEVKYFVVFKYDELTAIERVNRHSIDIMAVYDNWDDGYDNLSSAKRDLECIKCYYVNIDIKIIKVIKNWSIENV